MLEEDVLYNSRQLPCKETFWLDATMDASTFCDLELLAWSIFQQHV
jgi:hypothetical protein